MKSSRIAGALSIFILLSLIALKMSGDALYNFEANPESKNIPKDAIIICLAGAKGRIASAFELYRQGIGSQLVIVGAGPKATLISLIRSHMPELILSPKSLVDRPIYVETESRNTLENAIFVGQYLAKQNSQKEVVLITSGYHMKRARLMIEQNLRESVKIIPFTPPSEAVNSSSWWGSYLGMQVTAEEVMKLVLAMVLLPRM